jgi:general secretion pathway protein D
MPIARSSFAALIFVLPILILLSSCATTRDSAEAPTRPNRSTTLIESINAAEAERAKGSVAESAKVFKGTGVLVKGQLPGGGLPPGPVTPAAGGGVVLNFEGADLREVIRNILGDILGESYTIDPAVGGQVTIRTTSGISRDALPATLETLLRMNGATMVKEGGLFKIVPQAAAVRGNVTPQLGNSTRALPHGFSVQIVPLRYVGVREMMRLLEPFARDAQAVRFDEFRNLMILAGTERELANLMDAIALFDVDWLSGMSAGVFVLQTADVKSVMQELERALGDRNASPLSGILRVVPIERMNALLIITPQPAYLEEAKKWIARLDQGGAGDGPRFFVFSLQNQRAEKLGPLLQQAFTGRQQQAAAAGPPTLAPGTPAGTIVSPPTFQAQPFTPSGTPPPPPAAPTTPTPPPGPTGVPGRPGDGLGVVRNIQVVADKDNNTLLIVATAPEYLVIEAAIKKLDVPSRQVMIEVTIAEVSLKDEFDFGVEWLFKGGAPSGRGVGGQFNVSSPFNPGQPPAGSTTSTATTPGLSMAKGFTYLITNANFLGGVQAALTLLDTYGSTKVIANPHLAALDNQKATIKAGDRIPVNQQTLVGGTTNAVTTTSQYIDTGVLLQVTPHINAGGLITLDLQAEVSNPGNPAVVGDAPPINTRSIQTIVAVQSGQTMVMGGIINETKGNQSAGLPLLSRIPVLGGLFGNQTLTNNRTELVLFVTPRLVETEIDMKDVMNDLRRRMERLEGVFPPVTNP